MAKAQFGAIITDLRGSIGGHTFSANNFGSYMKIKRAPPKIGNALQSERRANFGYAAAYWTSDLTSGERAAWDAYAAATTFFDSLGNPYNVTGFNMFIRSATMRLLVDFPIRDAAPSTGGHGTTLTVDTGQMTADESDNEWSFNEAAFTNWSKTTDNDFILIYGVPQIPNTGTTKRAPERFIGFIQGNPGSPPSFPQTFAYPFGQMAAGNIVVTKFRRLEPETKVSAFTVANLLIQA